MIRCPVTHQPAETGFELAEVTDWGPQLLIDCLDCGQDHVWHVEDSFLV